MAKVLPFLEGLGDGFTARLADTRGFCCRLLVADDDTTPSRASIMGILSGYKICLVALNSNKFTYF
jgi:hypothetical protein